MPDKSVREKKLGLTGEGEWLNTSEAAAYLRISIPTLHNLTSSGKIKYYKLGRRNRYLRKELKDFLLSQARGSFEESYI